MTGTHPAACLYLCAYRCSWRLLLPPVAFLGRLDGRLRAATGKGFLPRTWQVAERAGGAWRETEDAAAFPGDGQSRDLAGTGRGTLWLHCASLGEAKGLWAFALSLAGAGDILLTATTDGGMRFLARQCAALRSSSPDGAGNPGGSPRACIAPFDHPAVVRRFLERHRVLGLCLYEVELWPHYLEACRAAGLPAVLVSGRMTAKAARLHRRFGGAGARLLDGLAWIQAQSRADLERFRSVTTAEVGPGFDFKAAHFFRRPAVPETFPLPQRGAGSVPRFAFVSLHFSELLLLRSGLPALMRRFDLIVFPRRMSEVGRFLGVLQPMGFARHGRDPGARHLLVDSMGLVADLLPDCRSVFVGGSLIPLGCHNLWEPLLAGAKILFGPYRENQESLARLLLERGIAEALDDPARIGECRPPGAEIAAACASLAEELRRGLESALSDGVRRIFVTFYPNAHVRTDAEARSAAHPARTRE